MNIISKLFPTPKSITMPAVGLDFSDATMRFISLGLEKKGLIPKKFAEISIPEGCIKGGRIMDDKKFVSFLSEIKNKYKLNFVRVSIPESQVYSFTLSLDPTSLSDIRGAIEILIEDNIPLKAVETVFDYHILYTSDKSIVVQVVALSEAVAENYYQTFVSAGLIPVSFELEGQAITRAVLSPNDKKSCMIVDFGANRTGITIVTSGTAIVTSTLDFGGIFLTQSLSKKMGISLEEAEVIKRENGLGQNNRQACDILISELDILKDEINKRYLYWRDRKSQIGSFGDIEVIYLCGGHSNLYGLSDYLSTSLKIKVELVNPWLNCFSLDGYIPEINKESSMSYVTTIGLALTDYIYD